jgi:transcription elongation factor Elf1
LKWVRCDKCGKRFALKLKERPVRGGGAEQFFRCPYCRHTYTVATITTAGVRIRQQMQLASPDQLPELRKRMAQEVRGA